VGKYIKLMMHQFDYLVHCFDIFLLFFTCKKYTFLKFDQFLKAHDW